jgi:AraC-like DNA-binding protein
MEKTLQFEDVAQVKSLSADYSQIDGKYLLARIIPGKRVMPTISEPHKINGLFLMIIHQGCADVEVNFELYEAPSNSVIAAPPGAILRMRVRESEDFDATMLFLAYDFLHEININPSAIALPDLREKRSSVYKLHENESVLLSRYFDLLHCNARDNSNPRINKNIASSLLAAAFYQIVQFLYNSIGSNAGGEQPTRRSNYVNDFIKLVHIYYSKERAVKFYADKLFISPKYLSLLVKEATGRSAANFIDEFVVLEAKNMLRFSGKNIQQIAYALNFSNQSSFGKYFKHLTGMSPTEYQKS